MQKIMKTKISEFAKKRITNILNGTTAEELSKEMKNFIKASMLLLEELNYKEKKDFDLLEEEFYEEYSKTFNLLIN